MEGAAIRYEVLQAGDVESMIRLLATGSVPMRVGVITDFEPTGVLHQIGIGLPAGRAPAGAPSCGKPVCDFCANERACVAEALTG